MMKKTDVRIKLQEAGYGHGDEVPVRVAAEVWGVSPKQVRQLGIEAARVDMTGMDCYTYLTAEQVVDLYNDPRVVRARARHQGGTKRLRLPEDDWRDALPWVLLAMSVIQEHGYAAGAEAHERSIDLNRRLTRALYDNGFCEGIYRSQMTYEERVCLECRGIGCPLCAGSGIWWPRREVEILIFRIDFGLGPFALMGETHIFPWVTDEMVLGNYDPPADTLHDPDPWLPWQWEGRQCEPTLTVSPTEAYAIVEWAVSEAENAA
jgi:hypothetical protein